MNYGVETMHLFDRNCVTLSSVLDLVSLTFLLRPLGKIHGYLQLHHATTKIAQLFATRLQKVQ